MPASRMLSAISFGVFCRSAPSTSAIMRSRKDEPGADGDAHHDPVGEHGGAAGDGRAVAAGLADDGRGLAGDRRLVDRGDAFDDLAVGRDEVAGLDQDDVAGPQVERRDRLIPSLRSVGSASRLARRRRCACGAARRPGLAAPFGDRLGEVGEQHREPQPRRDLAGERRPAAAGRGDRGRTAR